MKRPPTLEQALKTSLEIANNRPLGLTLSQAIAASDLLDTFPDDPPLPGRVPDNERAAELGWRIIDGGAA